MQMDAFQQPLLQSHPQSLANNNNHHQQQYPMGGSGEMLSSSGLQPRNNAFLEQQQQNKNQSPAQATDEASRRGLRSTADGQHQNSNQVAGNSVNNQVGGEPVKMEAEDSLLAVKSEPTESSTVKSQAELDNDLFAKMKATERKRKPPPVTKKEEEEEEPCKDTFFIRFFSF